MCGGNGICLGINSIEFLFIEYWYFYVLSLV